MPSQITNYQCPACNGGLHFSSATGRLECEYCGSSFSVEDVEAYYAKKDEAAAAAQAKAEAKAEAQAAQAAQAAAEGWDISGMSSDWGADAAGMKAYNCPSCGAELICDATTAATSCPYCGNPTVVPVQFHGMLKPDYILPFKLNKEAAIAALKNYYKGKRLLPKAFADQNHIEEIKGVYVPFWLFDGQAVVDITFNATRSESHRRGNQRVTITDHFAVRRAGTVDFAKIPVDGASKMPDTHMDAIEPFDYSELRPFSMAYMPGFLADKYDVDSKDCAKRADARAAATAEMEISQTAQGYTTCVPVNKNIRLRRGKVKYALLPVWMLSTRWNGKSFLFAMNGQTGKLIGDLPVDMGRYWAWFAGIAAPIAAVLAALLFLM